MTDILEQELFQCMSILHELHSWKAKSTRGGCRTSERAGVQLRSTRRKTGGGAALRQILKTYTECFYKNDTIRCFGLVYWGLTPQQQPGSYQGGEMMMMKSVFLVEETGLPGGNHRPTLSGATMYTHNCFIRFLGFSHRLFSPPPSLINHTP